MAFYGKVEYWDARYQKTAQSGPCEWYRSYGNLRHLLNPIAFSASAAATAGASSSSLSPLLLTKPKADTYNAAVNGVAAAAAVPKKPAAAAPTSPSFPDRDKCRVLILGCGNSTFGADMLRDGWTGGILNVDFSSTVIAQMQQQQKQPAAACAHEAGGRLLDYVCADITQPLEFLPAASFDLVVCKGALDAVLCGGSPRAGAVAMVSECARLLAPGHGTFFLVTAGNPDSRLEFLEHEGELSHYWRAVSVHPLPNNKQDGAYGVVAGSTANSHHSSNHNSISNHSGGGGSRPTVYCYICRKSLAEDTNSIPVAGKENAVAGATSNEASKKLAPPPPGFGHCSPLS